jgi:hypothetical protein
MARRVPGIDRDSFFAFCLHLRIDAKEEGGIIPLRPTPTQVYLVDSILEGLKRGVHHFVVLKCRQAMATTIGLAFDLYWAFRHEGVVGNIIADDETRRLFFRDVVRKYVEALPDDPEWRQPVSASNNRVMSFANRSSLVFLNANMRNKGTLGRGMGTSLVHGTECGFWKDESGLESLLASLAQKNPNRFYLFESTACGMNLFRDMCETATRAVSQKFIFIGWWIHNYYVVSRNSEEYKTYWDGSLNQEETGWANAVKTRYGVDVPPERIAWWRYMLHETFRDNLEGLYQEFPPLPELAFQFSGSPFIGKDRLRARYLEAVNDQHRARYFKFRWADEFDKTELEECDGRGGFYDLVVWDRPRDTVGVRYVLGCDPAHGTTANSDRCVIQVLRAYADRLEQVAELSLRNVPCYKCAWALLILVCGYPGITCVEVQGGGAAIIDEVRRFQGGIAAGYNPALLRHFPPIHGMQHYLYRRPDSLSRGNGTLMHWSTGHNNRERMLSTLRDYVERHLLICRSLAFISELSTMARTPDGDVQPMGTKCNDRVMAMALAHMAYVDGEAWNIGGTQYTYDYEGFKEERAAGLADAPYTLSNMLMDKIRERVALGTAGKGQAA